MTADELNISAENGDAELPEFRFAQAISCGQWMLAFGFDWAQAIVDQFDLVAMPRAPLWLAGAVNVEGNILPVIDLATYFNSEAIPMPTDRNRRLLLGGRKGESGENMIAVLFTGSPVQISYAREPLDPSLMLPERLREICTQMARSDTGQVWFEIDTDRFSDALVMSLMEI